MEYGSGATTIRLVKSYGEADADRFFNLAIQLSAAEHQKGHTGAVTLTEVS